MDKRQVKTILGIITFAVLLFCGIQNLGIVMEAIRVLAGLLSPFFIGLGIAFILNVPMRTIERKLFAKQAEKKHGIPKKLHRPLSMVLTLLFVLGVIFIVVFLIAPELVRTVRMLSSSIPYYMEQVQQWAWKFSDQIPQIAQWIQSIEFDWAKIGERIIGFVGNGAGNMVSSTVNAAGSIFSGIFDFFLGVVFAFYILAQKEKLGAAVKKMLYAFLPENKVEKFLSICRLSSQTFSNFLSGQCTEAVILGVLCFIGMTICRFPYALMISVLIAFMSLIPIFGAFIGVFVGAFLILMVSPIKALWFIIFFLVLQQLEGNLIYPRVVGSSVGLPSIWVFTAVMLGGSAMGIVGMLIFIPLFSILYTLLKEEVYKRLDEQKKKKRSEAK